MSKELISALSTEDKNAFYEYTWEYSHASQSRSYRAPVEDILAEWADKKESLYNVFGQKFILEKDFIYNKTEEDLAKSLQIFFNSPTYGAFQGFVSRYTIAYTHNERYWAESIYNNLCNLLAYSNFYDNSAKFEVTIPIIDTENTIVIHKGMKMMKVIQKLYKKMPQFFIINDNNDVLTEEQLQKDIVLYSQCVNEKHLSGKFCLSIHPLDFITASDNDSGWDSCMTYRYDGDYRRGIIEMMNSPVVICAYLAASNDMRLIDDYRWNNKKWREFFIVRDDIISGIKGYPYWNKEFEDIVINWIKELMQNYYKVQYSEIKTFQPDRSDEDGHSIKMSTRGHAMYNDFYHGNMYRYCITNAFDYETINYPGNASCMYCGETYTDDYHFHSTSAVCCEYCGCDNESCCDHCDDYIDPDNLTMVDGEYWCDYCVENDADYSDVGAEYHRKEDVYTVLLASRELNLMHPGWSYRYWNSGLYGNDFSHMPYPVYELSNSDCVTFIEDIIASGKDDITEWIWNYPKTNEEVLKDIAEDSCHIDIKDQLDYMDMIYEGFTS